MRFGKRSKGWAAAGRRLFGEGDGVGTTEPPPGMPIEASFNGHQEDRMASAATDEPLISSDPTQRLLTALGRFQRQVQSAEGLAVHGPWADEGMQQLISAIEIAIGEGWDDIREALTDTARILQTYEDAGRVQDALPFLQDAYEILCLMVGDLIVGNVRSGVLQKWRERYELAVSAILSEGLAMVEDETAMAPADGPDAADPVYTYPEADAGFEPEPAVAPMSGEPYREDAPFEAPEAPLPAIDLDADPGAMPFDAPDAHALEAPVLPSLSDLEQDADWLAETEAGLASAAHDDAGEDTALTEDLGFVTPDETLVPAPREAAPEANEYTAEPEDEGFILEPLSEEWDAAPQEAAADPLEEEEDDVEDDPYVPVIDTARVEEDARAWGGGDAGAEAPQPDAEAGQLPGEDDARDESWAVLPEEVPTPEPAAVEAEAAPEVAPELEPEPVATPQPGSAEALLATAQAAMRAGNVADAKRFALQLAANMARLEAEQAGDEMKRLEGRLADDAREIADSEHRVADCQKSLQDHEWHIGEREAAIQTKDGELAELRENLGGIEAGIEDIDAQIRALQERRGEEARRAATVREAIGQAEAEEEHLRADLSALEAARAEAAASLEAARQRVAALQETRQQHELDLRLAEAAVREREGAVAEIERTLGTAGGGAAEPQADGLLF